MFEPDEHQRLVQETARKYAQDSLAPVAAQLDREGRFPADQLLELAELGMMGVNIPEEYGGAQAGAVAYALAMMEIAQGCASTALTMAVTNMVGETIVKFGTEEQRPVRGRELRPLGTVRRVGRGGAAHLGAAGRFRVGAERREAVDHLGGPG